LDEVRLRLVTGDNELAETKVAAITSLVTGSHGGVDL
jgi:hypothetical protein